MLLLCSVYKPLSCRVLSCRGALTVRHQHEESVAAPWPSVCARVQHAIACCVLPAVHLPGRYSALPLQLVSD